MWWVMSKLFKNCTCLCPVHWQAIDSDKMDSYMYRRCTPRTLNPTQRHARQVWHFRSKSIWYAAWRLADDATYGVGWRRIFLNRIHQGQGSHYPSGSGVSHIEARLLQLTSSRSATVHAGTSSTRPERCSTYGVRAGRKRSRHRQSDTAALATSPLAHSVQTMLHHAFCFYGKSPVHRVSKSSTSYFAPYCGIFSCRVDPLQKFQRLQSHR